MFRRHDIIVGLIVHEIGFLTLPINLQELVQSGLLLEDVVAPSLVLYTFSGDLYIPHKD